MLPSKLWDRAFNSIYQILPPGFYQTNSEGEKTAYIFEIEGTQYAATYGSPWLVLGDRGRRVGLVRFLKVLDTKKWAKDNEASIERELLTWAQGLPADTRATPLRGRLRGLYRPAFDRWGK